MSMKLQEYPALLAIATFSSIPLVFAMPSAQAADFIFNASFSNGYTAQGSFTTKPGTPSSFSESNPSFPDVPFTTQYLESASLSIFNSTNTLLQSGNPVVGGISTSAYLRLDYDNSVTPNITALDINTASSTQQNTYYFISNFFDTSGQPIPGSTDYNLFLYEKDTDTYTFLGATSSIEASPIPEPFTLLGVATASLFGAGFKRKLSSNKN